VDRRAPVRACVDRIRATRKIRRKYEASAETTMVQRVRIDRLLVSRGLFESRARAQAAIAAGHVTADGVPVTRPAQPVSADAVLVAEPEHPYVSRGGVKLAAALAHFKFDVKDKICLDVGASTGGFTDALLRAGGRTIYAVDVGTDQLHPSLRNRREVVLLERIDIRELDRSRFPEPPSLVTIDVSFISLKLILPAATDLAGADAALVALIKPQFEVGRRSIGKGVVRDPRAQRAVCDELVAFAGSLGWNVLGVIESPILGGDGNREFLLGARMAPPE
jgi:23S rRNA (cytidine1920-2'-O)/16S rRNA (cytidine1409-2'-O)-methyltransferase